MVRHKKVLGRGDSVDNVVRASRWNDPHFSPDWLIMALQFWTVSEDPSTSTDFVEIGNALMGAGNTDAYQGAFRTMFDFSNVDQLRLEVYTDLDQNALAGEYRAQYSLDLGVSWHYFDGVSGPRVEGSYIISGNGPYVLRGDWTPISENAKRDCMVRIGSLNSDGLGLYPGAITLWGR
jgi:hypothetical protein